MPVDKTRRASWRQRGAGTLIGFVAVSVIGWVMVSGPASGRAEGSQSIATTHPTGAELASAEVPVAQAIPEASLIHAKELSEALAGPAAQRPVVLHVGYQVLYRGGHIVGSRYIGPASKPAGLQALREAVRKLPRKQAVVLYCGCCPWTDCPNVRPAYAAVESTGRAVKILYIAKNLQKDWIDGGLPTGSGDR